MAPGPALPNALGDYSPNTVGAAIAAALRKELLYFWAIHDGDHLNVALTDEMAGVVAPTLVAVFLDIANRRYPGLCVEASTALPEETEQLVIGGPGSAIDAGEIAELLRQLQAALHSVDLLEFAPDSRNALKEGVGHFLSKYKFWQRFLTDSEQLVLPTDAVIAICRASAPALLSSKAESGICPAEVSESVLAADYALYALPAGAPQGLARATQCRRRVFALERELQTSESTWNEKEATQKAERERSEARLMDVNHQLEERLKSRMEELRKAGQKITEEQRKSEYSRAELAERKREVAQLRHQLDQGTQGSKETQRAEQEHSRSMLRAAARESLLREKTRKRVERLQKCVDGEAVAELLKERETFSNVPSGMIDQIETNFGDRLQRRKEQYETALDDFQRQIERKRQDYNEVNKRLKEANAAYFSLTGTMGALGASDAGFGASTRLGGFSPRNAGGPRLAPALFGQ